VENPVASFQVGNLEVPRGSKAEGYLVAQDDDTGTVKLPISAVNGAESGPVLSVTGGMYGTIYTGINACIRAYNQLEPKMLSGTVVFVPVIEMTGFQKGMDESPIDHLNPNRVFPGDPSGTITQRIANLVFSEVIRKSQYHLDLRGGDLWEQLITFAISCQIGNKESDSKAEQAAKALGTEYYLVMPEQKGTLLTEANRIGVCSIILEASKGLATYDEDDIQFNMTGIQNLLKHLKMIDGKPTVPVKQNREEFEIHIMKAQHGGLLYLDCKCGQMARKGQKLGEVRNLRGQTLQVIIAPIDGIIHYVFPKHIKNPGERILGMRRIID
jgi:hypothetical protein